LLISSLPDAFRTLLIMSAAAVARAQAGAAVTAHGSAKGTTDGKGSALNLFDRYLKSTKGQGGRNYSFTAQQPDPEVVCTKVFWEEAAHCTYAAGALFSALPLPPLSLTLPLFIYLFTPPPTLVHRYSVARLADSIYTVSEEAGKVVYEGSTLKGYFGKVLDVYRRMYNHPSGKKEHVLFFQSIDEIQRGSGVSWFTLLLDAMVVKTNILKRELGEKIKVHKSPPFVTPTFLQCIHQLWRMNTVESLENAWVMAAQRFFCNRSSDTNAMLVEDIQADDYLPFSRFVVLDWQRKVGEEKPVPMIAGADDPRLCIFTFMGDRYSAGWGNRVVVKDSPTQHHLFPTLCTSGSPSEAISVSLEAS
jgi:hypothetical protein